MLDARDELLAAAAGLVDLDLAGADHEDAHGHGALVEDDLPGPEGIGHAHIAPSLLGLLGAEELVEAVLPELAPVAVRSFSFGKCH